MEESLEAIRDDMRSQLSTFQEVVSNLAAPSGSHLPAQREEPCQSNGNTTEELPEILRGLAEKEMQLPFLVTNVKTVVNAYRLWAEGAFGWPPLKSLSGLTVKRKAWTTVLGVSKSTEQRVRRLAGIITQRAKQLQGTRTLEEKALQVAQELEAKRLQSNTPLDAFLTRQVFKDAV